METLFDFGCFTGNWPYRRLRNGSLGNLCQLHRRFHVTGGLVSSLDAVFYNDPWEGDGPLCNALPEGYRLASCANPKLSCGLLALERGEHGTALRLYPGIHDYGPQMPELGEMVRFAGELGLPVIVTARLEDPRLSYLLRQTSVLAAQWLELAVKHPKTAFLLSAFSLQELLEISDTPWPENVCADTAGLCHSLFPLLQLEQTCLAGRIVFASFAPLQTLGNSWLLTKDQGKALACNLPIMQNTRKNP